jgi:hypothetical protein
MNPRGRTQKGPKRVFLKIMAENSPKCDENISSLVHQESQQTRD